MLAISSPAAASAEEPPAVSRPGARGPDSAQRAQGTPSEKPGAAPPPDEAVGAPNEAPAAPALDVIEGEEPPPTNIFYIQYGVAIAAELAALPGAICDTPGAPCILGHGGGVALRLGFRGAGPIYLGLAYQLSKQDPSNLYRFAVLQQARAEGRYYLRTARVTEPYGSLALGAAGYGDGWSIDTWGPMGSIGAGLEYQVTQRTVVGLGASYRMLYLSRFTDTSGAPREGGIAQMIGLELVLEQRSPSSIADERQPPAAPAR